MTIRDADVGDLLLREIPEFATAIGKHRAQWPDDPMLYVLIGPLFDFVISEWATAPGKNNDVAKRVYTLVERAIIEGTPGVRDCFVIQMIEPLANDPEYKYYPNLEPIMGPAALRELHNMREWGRRQEMLDATVEHANANLGVAAFSLSGLRSLRDAKVIADIATWKQLQSADQEVVYQSLLARWKDICGSPEGTLTITGPRETDFTTLR